MRPRVNETSFDSSQHRGSQPSGSISRSRMSQTSTSRGNESPDDEAAPEAREEPSTDSPL